MYINNISYSYTFLVFYGYNYTHYIHCIIQSYFRDFEYCHYNYIVSISSAISHYFDELLTNHYSI